MIGKFFAHIYIIIIPTSIVGSLRFSVRCGKNRAKSLVFIIIPTSKKKIKNTDTLKNNYILS